MTKQPTTKYSDIEILEEIRVRLRTGYLGYDEAKDYAQPVIDRMNEKMKEICKQNNRHFTPFTFSKFMR